MDSVCGYGRVSTAGKRAVPASDGQRRRRSGGHLCKKRKDEEGATDHAAESASFMRNLIKNRRDEIDVPEQTSNDIEISEVGSEESLLDDITPNPYVKFENKNITVYVKVDSNTGAYSFVAIDGDGNECDDYPLPSMSKLSVNPDTQTAIDPFGRKYPIMLD